MMPHSRRNITIATFLILACSALPVMAGVLIQCPSPLKTSGGFYNQANPISSTDVNCRHPEEPLCNPSNNASYPSGCAFANCNVDIDPVTGQPSGATQDPTVVCRSLTAGDGHVTMADGNDAYIFGFDDVTGVPPNLIMDYGMNAANHTAPTLIMKEGQKFYLTLTNAGMVERPDLVDPHTVHYHGFPNASSIFDGEPMAAIAIFMGSSLNYFYNNVEPGTYMYHCHVEASEHMQMGMLGNLYVFPAQDGTSIVYPPITGKTYTKFAYDDCPTPGDPMCGSTGYDKYYFLQETAFDPKFHHADNSYNPIDFAAMDDTYVMFNGRGYPDTVNPAPIYNQGGLSGVPKPSQPIPSLITVNMGDKLLLRLSSLSTVDFYTVTSPGVPMRVVGQGARLLRGPTGLNTSYATGSATLGGGEANDLLLDFTNVAAGTYFLYTSNLNHLSNNTEDFGGMMTEIVVN